jgi:hypothetical protein
LKLNVKQKLNLEMIDGKLVELKKLTPTGRGFVLTIPKMWVKIFCQAKPDGTYWVVFNQNDNCITIKACKET